MHLVCDDYRLFLSERGIGVSGKQVKSYKP